MHVIKINDRGVAMHVKFYSSTVSYSRVIALFIA